MAAARKSRFQADARSFIPRVVAERRGRKAIAFWGWQQEDQLLGDIRSFLEPSFLAAYDIISPLPKPFYHAGPFMIYRNAPHVNSLYRKSKEWRKVVKSPYYLAFDEWWGADLEDDMCDVVQRESEAGRLRAYTSKLRWTARVGWLMIMCTLISDRQGEHQRRLRFHPPRHRLLLQAAAAMVTRGPHCVGMTIVY